jgi:hypothetical protein
MLKVFKKTYASDKQKHRITIIRQLVEYVYDGKCSITYVSKFTIFVRTLKDAGNNTNDDIAQPIFFTNIEKAAYGWGKRQQRILKSTTLMFQQILNFFTDEFRHKIGKGKNHEISKNHFYNTDDKKNEKKKTIKSPLRIRPRVNNARSIRSSDTSLKIARIITPIAQTAAIIVRMVAAAAAEVVVMEAAVATAVAATAEDNAAAVSSSTTMLQGLSRA